VPEIVKLIKAGMLKWLRHLCRMQEQDPCRKLTFIIHTALNTSADLIYSDWIQWTKIWR